MEMIDSAHIHKFCRSCLGEKSEMQSLFTIYEGPLEVTKVQYSGMFLASTGIKPWESDGLPANICEQCRVMLVQAYCFKSMCERADERLRAVAGAPSLRVNTFTQTEEGVCLQMFNCGQCQKKFKSITALQRHCKRHVDTTSAACKECGSIFPDSESLLKHTSTFHLEIGDTKLEVWCDQSDKIFHDQEMKKESIHKVLVKEEPAEVYHEEEDDAHSDYMLPPIKEEDPSDHSDFPNRLVSDKTKLPKKKNKRAVSDGSIPLESHPCSLCPRVFSTRTHLESHQAKHAAKAQRYSCSSCDKTFNRSSHLKRHQLEHSSELGVSGETFPCSHCSKVLLSLKDLEKHIRVKHQGDSNKSAKTAFCSICERGFTTQRYLEIHMRNHGTGGEVQEQQGVNGFPCKACEHISETKVEARAHTQWHRRVERPFLCSECGQGFTRDGYLTVHMRRHRGEKPFSCSFCGKGFPRRSDLDIHERYHTEDKRHTCAICGKAFHRQYNLKVHLRVHTGERPYACTYCPKAFTQPNDLKAHVRRHTGERFTCELCSAQFLHGYHLTQHRRTVHAVDKPSHIRRLSKFPSAGPPHPPSQPPAAPTRGRARQAHIQLAAHMASILAAQQQPPPPLPPPAS